MPEQLITTYLEKGFFAAIAFIFTGMMGLMMFSLKQNKEFRAKVHEKIDENAKRVLDSHPSKDEFTLAFEMLGKQISSVQKDVREIREKL